MNPSFAFSSVSIIDESLNEQTIELWNSGLLSLAFFLKAYVSWNNGKAPFVLELKAFLHFIWTLSDLNSLIVVSVSLQDDFFLANTLGLFAILVDSEPEWISMYWQPVRQCLLNWTFLISWNSGVSGSHFVSGIYVFSKFSSFCIFEFWIMSFFISLFLHVRIPEFLDFFVSSFLNFCVSLDSWLSEF